MNGEPSNPSDYLQYLPAALQTDPILGQFLLAFEQILTGLPTASTETKILLPETENPPGLEALIGQLHTYLDPTQTPAEFLPWLANWVALSLREDWPEQVKRSFIRRIVPLYQKRGTKAGLVEMLKLYLENDENAQEKISVYEFDPPAHYFQVELELTSQDLEAYRRKERIARAIIDQEKPAHTFYALQIKMPTMRLISEDLARREGKNPQKTMLRITADEKYTNRTILGSSTQPPSVGDT
ncbi:phage tail protein I [Nodosilinea sp. FACHB-131]|uniref:phage tail protein I n=1 Tax=Cyanophyceae TaxID=3028117 RepID=UPI0016838F1E|nr:phage tail protein I [Nodosilinea sp. FACHB-131]MBD1873795.1 phage tail protein I [Nodosilinea sp. FACHB-131]